MAGLKEQERRPEASDETSPPATTAAPSAVGRILALQRTAGNRAVAAALLQRDRAKTPVKPAKDDSPVRYYKEFDPEEWAAKVAPIVRRYGITVPIVTVASNATYAFDADGGSLREIPIRIGDSSRLPSSTWRLDVAHATWEEPMRILMGDMGTPPLTNEGVKQLCEAMGYEYNSPAASG